MPRIVSFQSQATPEKEEVDVDGDLEEQVDGLDEPPHLCQACNVKDSKFVCASCSKRWYCSRDCQVDDWETHEEYCE